MDVPEPGTQSFIVKIWVEESAGEKSGGVWHGHITHVASHQRRYLKDLSEIQEFVVPYLEAMGVKPERRWQLRGRLQRLLRRTSS